MKQTTPTLYKICHILNDLSFHDIKTMAKTLNISQNDLLKSLNKLQLYGIEIESVENIDYRFKEPLVLINQDGIINALKNTIKQVNVFETIASTNDYLNQRTLTHSDLPIICLTEQQTDGKGRLGRKWHGPFGKNIYLSIALNPSIDLAEFSGLALAVGIGITQAIESISQIKDLKLKWPNDIYFAHKKLGGILIEAQPKADGFYRLVIGIGLNVNMHPSNKTKEAIHQPWTSITQITGTYQDRNLLIIEIINNTLDVIKNYENHGFEYFKPKWKKRDLLFNESIEIISGKNHYNGIAQGVDNKGCLKVKLNHDDTIKTFASGEASIRKL